MANSFPLWTNLFLLVLRPATTDSNQLIFNSLERVRRASIGGMGVALCPAEVAVLKNFRATSIIHYDS